MSQNCPIQFFTTKQVAAKLGKDPRTIRRWAEQKTIQYVRYGREYLYPEDQFIKKIICTFCEAEITQFRTDDDFQKAKISGLCSDCQRKTFGSEFPKIYIPEVKYWNKLAEDVLTALSGAVNMGDNPPPEGLSADEDYCNKVMDLFRIYLQETNQK